MNDIATDASRQFDQSYYSNDQQVAVITGGAA
jgi:hypothetical protein